MATFITAKRELLPVPANHEHEWKFYSHDHMLHGPHIHTYTCWCEATKTIQGRRTTIYEQQPS